MGLLREISRRCRMRGGIDAVIGAHVEEGVAAELARIRDAVKLASIPLPLRHDPDEKDYADHYPGLRLGGFEARAGSHGASIILLPTGHADAAGGVSISTLRRVRDEIGRVRDEFHERQGGAAVSAPLSRHTEAFVRGRRDSYAVVVRVRYGSAWESDIVIGDDDAEPAPRRL